MWASNSDYSSELWLPYPTAYHSFNLDISQASQTLHHQNKSQIPFSAKLIPLLSYLFQSSPSLLCLRWKSKSDSWFVPLIPNTIHQQVLLILPFNGSKALNYWASPDSPTSSQTSLHQCPATQDTSLLIEHVKFFSTFRPSLLWLPIPENFLPPLFTQMALSYLLCIRILRILSLQRTSLTIHQSWFYLSYVLCIVLQRIYHHLWIHRIFCLLSIFLPWIQAWRM